VLGEIDTAQGRSGTQLDDDAIYKIIRKVLQGIEEMLQYKPADIDMEAEKKSLLMLLPQQLDKITIMTYLEPQFDELRSAKSTGQATGIAMRFFKTSKLLVDGNEVASVVKAIYNG
jgi:hypothetical protein